MSVIDENSRFSYVYDRELKRYCIIEIIETMLNISSFPNEEDAKKYCEERNE